MRTSTVVETITCDFCGEEVEKMELAENLASESYSYTLSVLAFDIYYVGKHKIEDICQRCNTKLFDFLHKEGMLEHAQRVK